MTESSPGPTAAGRHGGAADDDESRRQAAARIRREHPGFVVIWAADLGRFRAWPLIRAPRGTVVTARTPEDLIAALEQIEQASSSRRVGARDAGPSSSASSSSG